VPEQILTDDEGEGGGGDGGGDGSTGEAPPSRALDAITAETPVVPVTAGDQIRLVLPAEPDYGRIARIAASSLALRLGLSFSEIEDLRIAVDETIILLLRPAGTGDITIEFTIEPHALIIDASAATPDVDPERRAPSRRHPLDPAARRRFEEIVADTVDEHVVDEHDAHVHLVKRY
jgi:hypothetical protein